MTENTEGTESDVRTLHCECGNEEYHIKWTVDGSKWAVCSECGRPTSAVGDGWEKQQKWSEDE